MTKLRLRSIEKVLFVGAIFLLFYWAGTTWDKWGSVPDERAQVESQRKSTPNSPCDCGAICEQFLRSKGD
jgi:hypothetical protein